MSLQTRTFGATNFTFFHQDTGLNTTSELELDNTGARITGSIGSPTLYPIRISELKMQFQDSAGNVVFKLSTGNNNSDSYTSSSISTTTSTSITRTVSPNLSTFTNQSWFYGWRKLDGSTTRGRRANLDNKRWANGSSTTGPIWAEVSWQTAASAPTSVSSTRTQTSVTVTWSAPSDNGGTAITGYRILYKRSVDSTWSSTGKFTGTTRTISGLQANTTYNFRLAATNAVTDGINSSYTSQNAHTGTNASFNRTTLQYTTPVWSTTSPLPAATRLTAYSTTLSATPVTGYSVVSGSLPTGLALNGSTGVISGTPTAVQTSSFTVRATNVTVSADRAFSLTVNPANPKVWNGTAFVNGTTRVWNGSAWIAGRIRVWNGSTWVDNK